MRDGIHHHNWKIHYPRATGQYILCTLDYCFKKYIHMGPVRRICLLAIENVPNLQEPRGTVNVVNHRSYKGVITGLWPAKTTGLSAIFGWLLSCCANKLVNIHLPMRLHDHGDLAWWMFVQISWNRFSTLNSFQSFMLHTETGCLNSY